ncbi:MAG TPA: sugar transferase [Terracidiphilus sp.]|nr:sugar transferase [Terracidiphilus sp.]
MTPYREDRVAKLTEALVDPVTNEERVALDEENFHRAISIERKRTERSQAPFVLMLLEIADNQDAAKRDAALARIVTALISASRDTDSVGWYKDKSTVGALFTGLVFSDKNMILNTILARVSEALQDELTFDLFNQISISLHFYPDEWDDTGSNRPSNSTLYPDLSSRDKRRKPWLIVKRTLDIIGSLMVILICTPVCIAIAVAIKLTSRGPVLFTQQRIGQGGRTFAFLKFRSMYLNNDSRVHREYVTRLIARQEKGLRPAGGGEPLFKIQDDKRVTPLGKFLRRSSLDELPQLLNVLKGDMSLVGPRPPIPYELAAYRTWHRRRLLEVKPGLTGLWQVTGRSRVDFDEMVRLDLRYATCWTPLLDLKILLRTPLAVIRGSGAC